MSLEEILAELERRRLMAPGNPMPGAVLPQFTPAPAPLTLRDIVNGAMVANPNRRPPTPGPVLGGIRG